MSAPVYVPIAPVLTCDGKYEMWNASLEEARAFMSSKDLESYVAHASAAAKLSTLLGVPVEPSHAEFCHQVGQYSLVLAFNRRQPEGVELTEMTNIGCTLRMIERP